MDCSTPGFPVLHYLLEFAQTHVHWDGNAIQPFHPLSPPPPPALNLSQHEGIFNESALCIRWPKYWSFWFSTSPSNEYSGMISFRIDCLDLLAIQDSLKLFSPASKFKSINSSVLSLPYGPTLTSIHDYLLNINDNTQCWLGWCEIYSYIAGNCSNWHKVLESNLANFIKSLKCIHVFLSSNYKFKYLSVEK